LQAASVTDSAVAGGAERYLRAHGEDLTAWGGADISVMYVAVWTQFDPSIGSV
jgi:hypothetical protein